MAPQPGLASSESNQIGAAEFLIPDRLRGIPLVSSGHQFVSNKTHEPMSESKSQTTMTTSERPNRAGETQHRSSQVGKRDASSFANSHGQRIQSQAEILFKNTGSTSSMAKLVKSTTTTRRPRTTTTRRVVTSTRRTTTTRRPPATTTTRRQRQPPALAKMIHNSAQVAARGASSTMGSLEPTTASTTGSASMRLVEPISSHKMSTLEAMSGTVGSFLASTLPLLTSTTQTSTHAPPPTSTVTKLSSSTSSTSTTTTTTASPQQVPVHLEQHSTTLTRAMQTLTTQPVNQRRTQPNLVSTRPGSSRLAGDPRNGYAGENWYLFKRPDGEFSAFEILVLMSNILIVSTIILVILINWIKVFKKRRTAAGQAQQVQQQAGGPQPTTSAGMSAGPPDDRASKLSLLSSGVSGITSTSTSAPADAQTTVTSTTTSQPGAPNRQQNVAAKATNELLESVVGTSQKIASEFNSATMNVANKAMAIVQPTESSTTGRGEDQNSTSLEKLKKNLKDELTTSTSAGQRAISRSVSDLSASGTAKVAPEKKSADDMNTPAGTTTTPDRVTALEELFSGTKKEIELRKEEEATQRMNKRQDQRQKQQMAQQQQGQGQMKGKGPQLHSSDSLESIELPNNLVESIKRTAPSTLRAQVDETLTPSPNLLLGEVEKPKPGGGMQIVRAEIEPAPRQAGKSANEQSNADRPENPMSREMAEEASEKKRSSEQERAKGSEGAAQPQAAATAATKDKEASTKKAGGEQAKAKAEQPTQAASGQQEKVQTAEVKNHQVVVNKLDKRKTNLEIVDLRDESVTGKMRAKSDGKSADQTADPAGNSTSWISMDGVAVVQPTSSGPPGSPTGAQQQGQQSPGGPNPMAAAMSPSEIIESRFHVDYKSKRKQQTGGPGQPLKNSDSVDSKQEEYVFNNIESELEMDNKMKNRKYFVYIVHDGHFTAKKECIARIELPPKRRITLAELRQLISTSQDISLSSLRRNRFKFVTETYRLLNENEDAAVLHQVYPTQGVFLKLNVNEQENQAYAFKGGRSTRLSSGAGATPSGAGGPSSSQGTIASRRRAANVRSQARKTTGDGSLLPAIEVNNYGQSSGYGRVPAMARGRGRGPAGGGAYTRSKSSVQMGSRRAGGMQAAGGMRRGVSSTNVNEEDAGPSSMGKSPGGATSRRQEIAASPSSGGALKQAIGDAASDLGANVMAGAKKLFSSTFHR